MYKDCHCTVRHRAGVDPRLLLTVLALSGALWWGLSGRARQAEAAAESAAAGPARAAALQESAVASTSGASLDERTAAARAAYEARAGIADWPTDPNLLVGGFWQCIVAGDVERATLYCPGALASDFAMYLKFRPTKIHGIEAPEAHPDEPGVMLYPVKLAFPGFPKKTVKVAVKEMHDGRLGIDGRLTIWW